MMKKINLGDVGKGSEMKLVVNMIMGTMMSAFAEGISLARSADLPQVQLNYSDNFYSLITEFIYNVYHSLFNRMN